MKTADDAIYLTLSKLLRVGVGISLVFMVAGLGAGFLAGPQGSEWSSSVVYTGIFALLALPPLQALAAFVAYRSAGNRKFTLAALGVLAVQLVAVAAAWA